MISGLVKTLLTTLVICTLTSCEQYVYFTEPQPAGKANLRKFPAKIQGLYFGPEDSTWYLINRKMILNRYEVELKDPVSVIREDDELTLEGNILRIEGIDIDYPVIRRNDSVFGNMLIYDTIVNLDAGGIVRKMGPDYFLNEPSDSLWIVYKLSFLKDGTSYLCTVNHKSEMDIFTNYCRVDTVLHEKKYRFLLTPDKKELQTLLRLETFTDTVLYIRQDIQ